MRLNFAKNINALTIINFQHHFFFLLVKKHNFEMLALKKL